MRLSMNDVLQVLSPPPGALLEALVAGARRCGVRVFLVGGPVRDVLLDRPVRDVDLVAVGPPGTGARAVAREGAPAGARIIEHERFGTVTVDTGEVSIDVSAVPGDPEATIRKAQVIRKAALAPANPSSQDRSVAYAATKMEMKARQELARLKSEEQTGYDQAGKPAGEGSPVVTTNHVA